MTEAVHKILLFMKRRPGMSVADFRDYYETRHAPLCDSFSSGVDRYLRRYVDAQPHPETGIWEDPPFDVITELWFRDEKIYRGTLAYITSSIMPDVVTADEANLFDRTSFRIATVVEHESSFGSAG